MRALVLLLSILFLAAGAGAYHDECPATPANVTLRIQEGGYYVLGSALYEETNAHSGLQTGELPPGCVPDTRIA